MKPKPIGLHPLPKLTGNLTPEMIEEFREKTDKTVKERNMNAYEKLKLYLNLHNLNEHEEYLTFLIRDAQKEQRHLCAEESQTCASEEGVFPDTVNKIHQSVMNTPDTRKSRFDS